ncbi:MAG: glutathione S-transferase N-terminal domain-containing protein [Xanthomonadales bacterium]|nr:glutathione S-transferase N-terminal domain-containing protein [Xanthomonadales bacterium]
MALTARGRSVMALFSSPTTVQSHRVRFVLAEKGINVEVVDVDPANPPEDLIDLNPDQSIPTLLDRELVLYDGGVITEYLDERYPHPPLMPVDPVSRARLRLAMYRLMKDWYPLVAALETNDKRRTESARKRLTEDLVASNDVFSAAPYFLNDELTLVDCAIAPLLWRLELYGVKLPRQAAAVKKYAERIFERESFQASLSEDELQMRE